MPHPRCSLRTVTALLTMLASPHVISAACPDFGTVANKAAGASPQAVVSGDFNRDGAADVVVGGAGSSAIFMNRVR